LRIDRNNPGKQPIWRHTEETGAYVLKEGRGGIYWYNYQLKVLKPKLIPFAKDCLNKRPFTVVQEDGAAAHASKYQHEVYQAENVQRLLWPANSPDLNAIEPCWFWMKKKTT
jgi:hypothetical protein